MIDRSLNVDRSINRSNDFDRSIDRNEFRSINRS
jgi:hypothetical protein